MREIRLGWKTIKQYTLQEVMEKLQISKVTALKLVQSGKLKAVKIARRYWINEEDLITFLEGKK
jgi:excisionase family DNA binding protein